MTYWKDLLRGDPLPWLLETDIEQPAVRYFALRDIMGQLEDDAGVRQAKRDIMASGPVPAILAAQAPQGYWVKPGDGYGPKYKSTVWQVMFLAQLGADGDDPRVQAGCNYVLSNTVAKHGGFTALGSASTFIHCLAGNLEAALIDLGMADDERFKRAIEFHARMVTGEGIAAAGTKGTLEKFSKSGTPGPFFACSANAGQPCAWGAVKSMLAFGKVPPAGRPPVVKKAIDLGINLLLGTDPAAADYPHPGAPKPSRSWFQFGYPIAYVTDVLQNLEALAGVGMARDGRLGNALKQVLDKQDERGRWKMEYTYNGKTWADIEKKGKPSKWVTLRALRVLRIAYPQ